MIHSPLVRWYARAASRTAYYPETGRVGLRLTNTMRSWSIPFTMMVAARRTGYRRFAR